MWLFNLLILVVVVICSGQADLQQADPPPPLLQQPQQVQVAWYELIAKLHGYIEDASFLYMEGFSNLVIPNNNKNLHNADLNIPLNYALAFTCPTPTTQDIPYEIALMNENFVRNLYINRLHGAALLTTLRPYWKKFYPSYASPSHPYTTNVNPRRVADTFELYQSSPYSNNPLHRDFWLFDFILSLPSEVKALGQLQRTAMGVSDPSFLFEDLISMEDNGDVSLDTDFVRYYRKLCVDSHMAVARDLQYALANIVDNLRSLAKGICGIDVDTLLEGTNSEEDEHDDEDIIVSLLPKRAFERQSGKGGHDQDLPWASLQDFKDHLTSTILQPNTVYERYVEGNFTVDAGLYKSLIEMYLEEYLWPYLDESVYCPSLQEEVYHRQQREQRRWIHLKSGNYLTIVKNDRGEEKLDKKDIHVMVQERQMSINTSLDHCLSGIESVSTTLSNSSTPLQSIADKISTCRLERRTLYLTTNLTIQTQTDLLSKRQLGGCMTTRELACYDSDSSDGEICMPTDSDSSDYNVLNILAAYISSPNPMMKATHSPHGSLSPSITLSQRSEAEYVHEAIPAFQPVKTLILGLGGGELHHSLLKYFPSMSIESIEVSRDVVETAWEYFGFGNPIVPLICDIQEYDYDRQSFHNIYDEVRLGSSHNSRIEEDEKLPNQADCRSKVKIIDGWKYIDKLHDRQLSPANTTDGKDLTSTLYDYIYLDMYDANSTYWSGDVFDGESIPSGNQWMTALPKVYSLLTPYTGIVIAHLHKDSNFKKYYNYICEIFGIDQVIVFEVSNNDAMVIAGRDRFYRIDANDKGKEVEVSSNKQLYQQDDIQYKSTLHLCDYTDSHLIAKNILEFSVNKLNFTPRMSLMYLLSLDCHPVLPNHN